MTISKPDAVPTSIQVSSLSTWLQKCLHYQFHINCPQESSIVGEGSVGPIDYVIFSTKMENHLSSAQVFSVVDSVVLWSVRWPNFGLLRHTKLNEFLKVYSGVKTS